VARPALPIVCRRIGITTGPIAAMAARDTDPTATFGARVRARRVELGMSQEALGMAAGLHRTYIGSLERGERNVSLLNIVRVAEALAVDPGDLVRGLAVTPPA
jgi:DNA-binding XRE family transcriptional regulator